VRFLYQFLLFGLFVWFYFGLALVVPSVSKAEIDSELTAQGWREFTFDDKAENRFRLRPDIGGRQAVIEVESRQSVSIAYLPFDKEEIDLKKTPYLAFSWQRLGRAINTDVSKKGGDDRIIAVYVAFPYQPDKASFSERLLRPLVEAKQGKDAPGRILTYLWAGGPMPGQWFENPYTGKAGYMRILQAPSAEAHQWFDHKPNIAADFKDSFGYWPPSPSYIAIASDSDDTSSHLSVLVTTPQFQ